MTHPNTAPNRLRRLLPAFAVMAAGSVACGGGEELPTPTATLAPAPTGISEPTWKPNWKPECTDIAAQANPQGPNSFTFTMNMKNDEIMGVHNIGQTHFDFGDGRVKDAEGAATTANHTYLGSGEFTVKAVAIMNVAPNVEGTIPGYPAVCPPITVAIP